jgi:cell division protein FtsW (lipid II flippase)
MAAVEFINNPGADAAPFKEEADRRTAGRALRITWLLFTAAAFGAGLCAFLRTFDFGGEGFRYEPATPWLRVALGAAWLLTAAVTLTRAAAAGRAPGPVMVVFGILALSVGRLSSPPWHAWALAALAGLAFVITRRALSTLPDGAPLSVRRAIAAALWLIGFGLCCMSAGDTPGTVRQLAALFLGSLFLLPLPVAVLAKLVATVNSLIRKGWMAENVMWAAAVALLCVNAAVKILHGSSVPQLVFGGVSVEPFEVARGLAVTAFALSGHRWAQREGKRGWLPPLSVLAGPALTVLLYLVLREKGTLALTVAGFALTWATQVGGRSTIVMWLTGGLIFVLILFVAHERLAIAAGQVSNSQAEAAMLINSHPGLIGAAGAARPTAYLGPAANADYMLSVVASQAGMVGLLFVLGATLALFGSLFRSLWSLEVGAPRGAGVAAFSHLLLPAVSSMVGYSLGLISGLPFPFLARGGNHLLVALFLSGLLLAIGAGGGRGSGERVIEGAGRTRLVLALSVAVLAAVSLLVVGRGGRGWGEKLTADERSLLLTVPAAVPYFHGTIYSADGVELAATRFDPSGGASQRTYEVDPGLAPVMGAGSKRVQETGLQSRLFWTPGESHADAYLEWLLGPGEVTLAPVPARLTVRADWTRRVGELARSDQITGAVLVVRRDGAVEVALSLPGYDPNRSGEAAYYRDLATDPRAPMFNRAFRGIYPPASTVKPPETVILADRGLADGEVMCDGSRCSGRVHGLVRGSGQALQVSCNIWFQRRSRQVPRREWKGGMEAFGFGPLEVPYAGPSGAPLPAGPGGVNQNEAIGQGWTATPVNIAAAYLTLLEGRPVRPYIVDAIGARSVKPAAIGDEFFSPSARAQALAGMRLAASNGTARTIWQTLNDRRRKFVGAKTGTAETDGRTHALFVAATTDHVVVVVNEYGGKGASLGPLVGRILNIVEEE